jgi:predicted esterase
MAPAVEALVKAAIERVREQGGRVAGLIGFSQGTKVVAGLLRASELRARGQGETWCEFDFALSVCASYPPPLFPACVGEEEKKGRVRVPTFHVQGVQDEWNWAGKGMIEQYYDVDGEESEMVEWDMGHHYPVAVEESERIANWMIEAWRRAEEGRKASKV